MTNPDPDPAPQPAPHAGRAPDPLVTLEGASVRYGSILALAPTHLQLARGQSVALVGSNGSGKSTMLGLLARLIVPTRGAVRFAGQPKVSFVAQQHAFHRWMPLTVDEVVRMGRFRRLGLVRPLRRVDREAITEVSERLEVADLAKRTFGQLSGGQRQRVLVTQALVDAPDLLLLDEPITGLDLASQEVILEVIGAERDRGAAVVFSTHHLDEARRADRVVLLAGAVVADGPPEEALQVELLAAAFGGRLSTFDDEVVVFDEHGHGHTHDACDHPDPGR
jgi:ABC-type Mn2+/Zn2+ transport system ATPase subunit